jgi:hypothetical protein
MRRFCSVLVTTTMNRDSPTLRSCRSRPRLARSHRPTERTLCPEHGELAARPPALVGSLRTPGGFMPRVRWHVPWIRERRCLIDPETRTGSGRRITSRSCEGGLEYTPCPLPVVVKLSAGVPTTVSGNAVRFPVGQQISRRERLDRATELARLMHGARRDPKLGIERDQK